MKCSQCKKEMFHLRNYTYYCPECINADSTPHTENNDNEFLIEYKFNPSVQFETATLELPMDGSIECDEHGTQTAVKFSNCRLCLECVRASVQEV